MIFISVLIFIITFTLVYFQSVKEGQNNIELEQLQNLEYSDPENQEKAWTQVDGSDSTGNERRQCDLSPTIPQLKN